MIIDETVYEEACQLFKEYGAYIINNKEIKAVQKIILTEKGSINANIVGQSAYKIA